MSDIEGQLDILLGNASECYDRKLLRARLERSRASHKPLRIKLGLDPSRPDIHIGHTVVLRKLRQFMEFGHQGVLIIGNYTAMVGDPSGKSKTRPRLSEAEVEAAAATYLDQMGLVVDTSKLEVRRNGDWFSAMNFGEVMGLAARITVARLLERDDFTKRFAANEPISLHEFFYPLMQGYDSVMVRADVELGGTDQTFNLLMGRRLQEEYGQEAQVCLTMPLIEGLDGVEKMSKSLGNAIGVTESPTEMFGKTMSIPDAHMRKWFSLLTDVAATEADALCDPGRTHPREAKDRLARAIVSFLHDDAAADAASADFLRRFREGGLPTEIPVHRASAPAMAVADLLVEAGLVQSKSEARRTIEQGGVSLLSDSSSTVPTDTRIIRAFDQVIETDRGWILKVGKRKFARLMR